ncbi:helix-turn-helix transcriptional regulator [Romboutsia ilealis]|uniref:helix-turn-helix transcriptional regulator n=1 Tax=Romboutsia ilealis TaxID=1115758 RepID=UPI0025734146|nr:helix-turn-helix domain-containing protein [Romboutsia ilealis]
MDFIISVVKDFYECCNIPVKVISSEFDNIYQIGYNDYFEEIFPSEQIKTLVNNSGSHLNIHLDKDVNIYYKVISISKFNKNKGFFILGPILNKPIINNTLSNIPYRSLECSNYMSKLILNIVDDKFDKTMNKKSFNPYIRKAIEYVHENYSQDITIDSLCNYLDINKSYFCSLFKKYTGNTFSYFLNHFRVEKSKKLLRNSNLSLLDIAIEVGFNNQNYYSMVFKKYTNMNPSKYRISTSLEE